MIDIDKFEKVIRLKHVTKEDIANMIGINKSTFYRKIKNGGDTFTVGEVNKMVNGIPLTKREAEEIFFKETVA